MVANNPTIEPTDTSDPNAAVAPLMQDLPDMGVVGSSGFSFSLSDFAAPSKPGDRTPGQCRPEYEPQGVRSGQHFARRLDAIANVIADPGAYAGRMARQIARRGWRLRCLVERPIERCAYDRGMPIGILALFRPVPLIDTS